MNEKKLNVLFISSWYPTESKPLLGIFFKRHAAAIAGLCNVSSIYAVAGETSSSEECIEDGIYTVRIVYKKVTTQFPVFSQLINIIRYFSAFKKAAFLVKQKKGKPDILHLNVIFPAGLIALYLKRKWKIPFIAEEQWTGYFEEDGRYKGIIMKLLAKRVVRKASGIITISHDLKNKMIQRGLANEYYVISNIVDTEVFTIEGDKEESPIVKFIHVSSLDDAQKNVSGIIHAFHQLHNDFANTGLTIVGNGDERRNLEEMSKTLGLAGAVHFAGEKTNRDLAALLQNSDAFVLFSNYETQAIVLLEALCCGKPVIATKTGGIQEYVNDWNGILIEPKNEKQLLDAMKIIVTKKNRFSDSYKIRQSVVNKVNSKKIARKFIDVYNNVLRK